MAPAKTSSKASKVKANISGGDAGADAVQKPNWPPLEPAVPLDQLEVQHLVPGQIVTASGFWSRVQCKSYVRFLASLPLVTTPGVPKRGDAVRVNDRFQVDDAVFADRLWRESGLREVVLHAALEDVDDSVSSIEEWQEKLWGGQVLGLNPNIRIYRYRAGQFFDQHYDESNSVALPDGAATVAGRTTWTLLLYLTCPATGCWGGETVFYPEAPGKKKQQPSPIVVGLETGMALLHRHGRECMLHEGREVTDGEKWVIRSDLVVRR